MAWVQIRLHVEKDQVEIIEDALIAAGSLSVTLEDDADQPILEPDLGTTPVWDRTRVTGLFAAETDEAVLLEQLNLYCLASQMPLPTYKLEIVEDKDWVREWMDNYHPMQFGDRLWICPSWQQPPEPDAINLMLDPGLAFGTGTHPTTALCLKYLDQAIIGDEQIVDFGCGSGILGIAALLLGAKHMMGTDIDPQAIEATRANAERNGITTQQYQVYLAAETPAVTADMTVANILAGPLAELAPTLAHLTRSGGKLALSGILREQAESVAARYSEWFEMDAPQFMEDWALLTGVKH